MGGVDRTLIAVAEMMASVPHVMFCAKDRDGRYTAVNQAFADRAGVATPADVIGRTASDFFPPEFAAAYEYQDAELLRTGRTLNNELELITRPDGSIGWYVTAKAAIVDDRGQVVGLMSVSADLRTPVDAAAPHRGLAGAVEYARVHFAEPVAIAELAEVAGMSVAHLERSTRRVLGLTPKQLVLRFRLDEATRRLAYSSDPIARVANDCGYYDQSAFTRHFKRVVGVPPSTYRDALTRRKP